MQRSMNLLPDSSRSPGGGFPFSDPALDQLDLALAALVPGAPLVWGEVPSCGGLCGLFLEEESALRPLPAACLEAVMAEPPFWALLWPSGHAVCRLLHQHPDLVRGRTVLDFGCGGGLVACTAARAGAARVIAVDIDPLALSAAHCNARVNQVEPVICDSWEQPVDLLVLADFLYDRSHLPLFERLQARAQEVLVVDSRLTELERPDFLFLGEGAGVAVPDLDPHREFGRLRLWYRGPRGNCWRRAWQGGSKAQ
jgi:predicted nicotinamide N-methyase